MPRGSDVTIGTDGDPIVYEDLRILSDLSDLEEPWTYSYAARVKGYNRKKHREFIQEEWILRLNKNQGSSGSTWCLDPDVKAWLEKNVG